MSKPNLVIKKAVPRNFSPRIALLGAPGTGKTLSALYIAAGIAGQGSSVFCMDSSNTVHRYASTDFVSGFYYTGLTQQSQFFLEHYEELVKFNNYNPDNLKCFILDNISDMWRGNGGAYSRARTSGGMDWGALDILSNRFLSLLEQIKFPVICTINANPVVPMKDGEVISNIPDFTQHKDLLHKFDFVYRVDSNHRLYTISAKYQKEDGPLLLDGQKASIETGEAIRKFCKSLN